MFFPGIGDYRVFNGAREEARKRFNENRQLSVDTPMRIQDALEAAHILKTNVVQGVKVEANKNVQGEEVERYCELFLLQNFGAKRTNIDLFPSKALRIHEHIERGDNDTIKTAGDKIVKVKPCSK